MFLLELLTVSLFQYILFNISYYVTSIALFIVDYFKMFRSYKIQDREVDMITLYKKVIPTVLVNTFIVPIPMLLLATPFINFLNYELTFLKFIFDIILTSVLTDILFYKAHKLFHDNHYLNKYHKKHHEINYPIGISALYMTKVDALFGNLIPSYLPLILISAHPVSIFFWSVFGAFNTVLLAHSGFKWLADFHDYHHINPKKNFGINIFMDRMLRTSYIPIQNNSNINLLSKRII